MPTPQIKSFYQDPACAICQRHVRGWARSFCDTCGRLVCRRHRPYFQQNWSCPDCVARQNAFTAQHRPAEQTTSGAPAAPLAATPSASPAMDSPSRAATVRPASSVAADAFQRIAPETLAGSHTGARTTQSMPSASAHGSPDSMTGARSDSRSDARVDAITVRLRTVESLYTEQRQEDAEREAADLFSWLYTQPLDDRRKEN